MSPPSVFFSLASEGAFPKKLEILFHPGENPETLFLQYLKCLLSHSGDESHSYSPDQHDVVRIVAGVLRFMACLR